MPQSVSHQHLRGERDGNGVRAAGDDDTGMTRKWRLHSVCLIHIDQVRRRQPGHQAVAVGRAGGRSVGHPQRLLEWNGVYILQGEGKRAKERPWPHRKQTSG